MELEFYRACPEACQNGQCIFGVLLPMPLSLQLTLLNTLMFFWSLLREGSPFDPAPLSWVGQSTSHLILVGWLAAWRQQLAGRPTFGLGCCLCFCLLEWTSDWNSPHHSSTLSAPGGIGGPISWNDLGQLLFPSQTPLSLGRGGSWTREWGMEKRS